MESMLRLLFSLAVLLNVIFCSLQSAQVEGTLMCEGKPAANILVKMYDDGTISDTLMGKTTTDTNGRYTISGASNGLTTIDPKINIYHDCNDGIKPCQRKFTIFIPSNMVSSGNQPNKTYNAGTMELSGKLKGESRSCIH